MAPFERLRRAREATLRFVGDLPDELLTAQPHPDFSPICWHLGHVAFTEALWALDHGHGDRSLSAPFAARYAQGGRPKRERARGYDRQALWAYLDDVRARVAELWATPPSGAEPLGREYLAWFLASHEHQHRETMATVLGLMDDGGLVAGEPLVDDGPAPRLPVAGDQVRLGTDDTLAYDNERPSQLVDVAPFALDAHPVTSAAWCRFMEDGGYARRELWTEAGGAWRTRTGASAPRGWEHAGDGWSRPRLGRRRAIDGREPVCGVSAYEAEAFARWRGGRLPTEAEFELVAQRTVETALCVGLRSDGPRPVQGRPAPTGSVEAATDLLGNVWEWTADTFEPRPGFEPFPYRGYSEPYFGGTHRVLKGGSFATDPSLATPHFRNWYVPSTREVNVGLRVAYSPA